MQHLGRPKISSNCSVFKYPRLVTLIIFFKARIEPALDATSLVARMTRTLDRCCVKLQVESVSNRDTFSRELFLWMRRTYL